jgi:hypothetical protein
MNSEDTVNENKLLKDKLEDVLKENEELKDTIQKLQDLMAYEITTYFEKCNSLKKTADKFYFENVRDCYYALCDYDGCSDSANDASDYKEYYKEIFDRDYDENSDEDTDINSEDSYEGSSD